jgi:hypothetical protein
MPISKSIYRKGENTEKKILCLICSCMETKNREKTRTIPPCPRSPNMTANKNGKVTIANTLGLTSL